MFKVKRFNESVNIYDADIKKIAPKSLIVKKDGKSLKHSLGNIMENSDMFQITFDRSHNEAGYPDTLEIDMYFIQPSDLKGFKIDIDITYGDLMVSEFSILPPKNIHQINDPEVDFCFDKKSVDDIVKFINDFTGFDLSTDDLDFLLT
jgi:hypothetical protein